jgi:TolA-binding protein
MTDERKFLEKLGVEVRAVLGSGPGESDRMKQRHALVSMISAQPRSFSTRYQVAGLAAVFLAITVGVVLWQMQLSPIEFRIGDSISTGETGSWVETKANERTEINFAGGTRFELAQSSAVRIALANMEKVRIDLSDGKVSANVKGNGETSWMVQAGPYQVEVVGTVFAVNWNSKSGALDVSVSRGGVLVSGAGLNEHGIRLAAGHYLEVAGDKVLVNRESARKTASVHPVEQLSPETASNDNVSLSETERTGDAEPVVADKVVSRTAQRERAVLPQKVAVRRWEELYVARDYAGAVELAQREGIDELLDTLDVESLWQLASAARYARKGQVATETLKALKKRFGQSRRARTASFMLGRVALELQKDPNAAQDWFTKYINEDPGGPLAEEALGRLIDACQKAGKHTVAKKNADAYLARYPDGLFAGLARSVK